jgi:hypothetical protein
MPVGDVWGNAWGDSWDSSWKVATTPPVVPPSEQKGGGRSRPGPKGRRIKRYIYDDDVEHTVDVVDVMDAQAAETEAARGATKKQIRVRYRRERGSPVLEGDLRDAAFDAVARAAREEGMDEVSIDLGRIIGLTDEQVRTELMAQIAAQAAEEEFILAMVV